MYVLDVESMEWVRVPTSLAPLGRKGHSMVLADVESEAHLVIFGGYSSKNDTYSNSLHILSADSVKASFRARQATTKSNSNNNSNSNSNSSSSTYVERIKSLRPSAYYNEEAASPIWRVLHVNGPAPSPRYRHSCTALTDPSSGDQLLVVIGGIGPSSNGLSIGVSLNDTHILDMTTLTWTKLDGGYLSFGLAGEGPALGIYGHAAFAVDVDPKYIAPQDGDASHSNHSPLLSKFEVVVFGGSSNVHSSRSDCYQYLLCFNLASMTWRRVQTAYTFPSARNGHTGTVVHGWAPSHRLPNSTPSQKSVNFHIHDSNNNSSSSSNNNINNISKKQLRSNQVCAVIFGGVGSHANSVADVWALDLKWKPAGVERYHSSLQAQIAGAEVLGSSESYANLVEKERSFGENRLHVLTEAERRQTAYDRKYLVTQKGSSSKKTTMGRCMSDPSFVATGNESEQPDSKLNTTASSGALSWTAQEDDAIGKEFLKVRKISSSKLYYWHFDFNLIIYYFSFT